MNNRGYQYEFCEKAKIIPNKLASKNDVMYHLNKTLFGTEKYDGFLQKLQFSFRSAMEFVPCKCILNNPEPACEFVIIYSQVFDVPVCQNIDSQVDILKGVGNVLFPHHRFVSNPRL